MQSVFRRATDQGEMPARLTCRAYEIEVVLMMEADLGQRSQTRQCLTCKNKGCIGHCRFAKPMPERTPTPPRGGSDKTRMRPRLYRSPIEPFHWLVRTDDGWFRFPPKLDGWAERCAATNVSRQKVQRVPLRMAFNTGLTESLELQIPKRAA
jgi:hypothetical protein